ncbi:uncharacterized protein DNG_03828 [Cephalotrichum gorgonifer]|uniref:Uncharacterized protein n=1 Tax=Cephalotrichum gorgonifer TaxID=2041049 RepID=A0AAE8SU00_9PEZI|nr:uncharacterized protein DNG_03828 [Cephalotrichum gorgonifer]
MGKCAYNHDTTQASHHGPLTTDDLSDSVVLPAFREVQVNNGFDWYGIRNVKTLASFNCLRGGRLAVPGLPGVLRRPTRDITYSVSDAQRFPEPPPTHQGSPFNSLTRALEILTPDTDPSSLAVITTAGCLRRLAAFLSRHPRSERLNLEFRDGTLFMSRWEGDGRLHHHLGLGKQFEEDTRRFAAGLGESLSSHVVAGYEIGGLKMAVQIEVDAFECDCHAPSILLSPTTRRGSLASKMRRSSVGGGGRYDALSLIDDGEDGSVTEGILRVGSMIKLSCAVEIKTRMRGRKELFPYLPQLYFQQIPRVFLAIRDNRRFAADDMALRDESENLMAWEAENQVVLARLVALLRDVRAEAERMAVSSGECKMALVLMAEGGGREALLYRQVGEA